MNYSSLNDLIDYLEYGTKLHIGVLFFGSFGNEKLVLPHERQIHKSPLCGVMKETPNGFKRCYYCRNYAVKKALTDKKAFGGLCINGVYEYIRPVIIDDKVVSVIFIGNILPQENKLEKLKWKLRENHDLIRSLESGFSPERCERIGELIESYIRMILELCPNETKNEDFDPLIENLKSYIEANLEYEIDLSMLANIFHYNEKYLGRLFKNKTGFSFSEWVNLRRTERAGEMLLYGKESVISISGKVGFNNVTYFNRVFKKYYGVTPSEYRRNK